MPIQEETIEQVNLATSKYKYGFSTDLEVDKAPKGLNENIIRLISSKKNEPEWMLDWRLKAFEIWKKMKEPEWAKVDYPKIDYQDIYYYSAPKNTEKLKSLDEVDPELLKTYEKLGIPLNEQKALAGVAVDAVFDSVSVVTTFRKQLEEKGVIFCPISEAIKTHPDRPNGSKEKFQLVTKCYLSLVEKLKKEASDKQHNQLRDGSRDYWKSQVSPQNKAHMQRGQKYAKDNFNLTMFNKIFEENKIYDPNEEGYENWFKDDSPDNQPSQPVFSNKFNIDVFNRTFDGWKEEENNSQIVEYKDPQAIQSCDKMGYSELGSNKANFTKTGASQGQDLKYSDLKLAYTKGNLINPNQVKYKTYRNINELEKDRSNLSYEMSPEDAERRAIQSQIEQEEEEARQARLRNNDALSAQHYNRVHQRMLGYSSQPDLNR